MDPEKVKIWKTLYEYADSIGHSAGKGHIPKPMVIYQTAGLFDDQPANHKRYVIEDGPCGFASVVIKPANHSFVKWLKYNDIGYKRHAGGWNISINDHGQSMEKKIAHANEMARVLKSSLQICKIWVESRMD